MNTTTFAAADLLYRLNAAMFDASIVCWYTKYKTNFWRPITAIRQVGWWASGGLGGPQQHARRERGACLCMLQRW